MKTISRYIMTLALLLTVVGGAWAQEQSETIATTDKIVEGTHFTISNNNNYADGDGMIAVGGITVTSKNGETITKVVITCTYDPSHVLDSNTSVSSGTKEITNGGGTITVTGVNASTFTFTCSYNNPQFRQFVVYYADASASSVPKVAWNASTKTGTFAMPAFDAVLTPIYAKAAAFATTGTEPEVKTLLPEAAEGVIAGTDASLIAQGTGIVAFAAASTEVKQGTLMYAIGTSATQAPALTAFSATVPTAKDIADDGATVYVWYYIQGADAPQGEAATLDNTFDNTEPACLTVQVLTNKFDIQFNAANANTIDATQASKGTVTVNGTDKTSAITEGKLKAVKMGSEVKLEAKPGYKFRKVEVKKAAPALKTLTVSDKQLNYVEGDTWQQAIERTENEGSSWRVQGNYIYNGGYTLFIIEGTYLYVRPGDTINATKNYSLEAD